MPSTAVVSDNTAIEKLKERARAYLKANQVEKALRVYAKVLQEYPQDLDSLLIMGDSYLIIGERKTALRLYRAAASMAEKRKDIERRIMLASSAEDGESQEEDEQDIPLEIKPQAVLRLLKELTGRLSPVKEEEITSAENLLNEFLHSTSPAQSVAEHLDEIDLLLPALIELNIQQARSDGRSSLVEDLEGLLGETMLQLDLRSEPSLAADHLPQKSILRSTARLLVVGLDSYESPFRQGFIIQALEGCGFSVTLENGDEVNDWSAYNLVIARNPHCDASWIKGLAARAGAGLPNLVDLDLDYQHLPQDHAEYKRFGVVMPNQQRSYIAAIQLADVISTPSNTAAVSFKQKGYSVKFIPDGWSQGNPLWQKPAPPRSTINLGLIVSPGQVEDVTMIRRAVVRVLREFPQSRLVISGDPVIYQLFDNLTEVRRMFLPPSDKEDYPFLLAQVDIMLEPLQSNVFNEHRSDRKLMEAGIRGIPWVASPIHAFAAWGSGGLLAYSADEWYSHLRSLVMDSDLRVSLGREGRQKAMTREIQRLRQDWAQLVDHMLVSAQDNKPRA